MWRSEILQDAFELLKDIAVLSFETMNGMGGTRRE
jgi:hypothetical protein